MKIVLRSAYAKEPEEKMIGEAETDQELWKMGFQWLKENGFQIESYSRMWMDNGETYCDFGSWSWYLVITS